MVNNLLPMRAKRDRFFTLRLTALEIRKIKQIAQTYNIKPTVFVRELLFRSIDSLDM
jgi:hypothetical protein